LTHSFAMSQPAGQEMSQAMKIGQVMMNHRDVIMI
jgi:hypothetical protein